MIRNSQSNSFIKQLQLFECKGVLRCNGRFLHAKIKPSVQSPILLPKIHYFTVYVYGVRHTVTSTRQEFWIPNIRQQARPDLRKCRVCIHWEGSSFRPPLSAPLSADRVTQALPFTFAGCDFAGPLLVFDGSASSKAYVCLFTCAVTRAIHLELVHDLTSASFLLALRRFIACRGVPTKIISNNAKTLNLAKTAIDRLWHDVFISTDTLDYVSNQGIHWQFNVERAPWYGGFFERTVGLLKRTLQKAAGKSKLSSIRVTTLFTEIEAILNSRLLTFVYSDAGSGQPLTPNNFPLHGQPSGIPSYGDDPDPNFGVISSASTLLQNLSVNQYLLDYYWSIWHDEYLAHLREFHHHWRKKQGINTSFSAVGDLVLVIEEGQKRAKWKVGIVDKTCQNKDNGIIRLCCLIIPDRQYTLQKPGISFW